MNRRNSPQHYREDFKNLPKFMSFGLVCKDFTSVAYCKRDNNNVIFSLERCPTCFGLMAFTENDKELECRCCELLKEYGMKPMKSEQTTNDVHKRQTNNEQKANTFNRQTKLQ